MCQLSVLSKRNSTIISHCLQCQRLLIWQRNIVLNFNPEEFISFRSLLHKLDFSACLLPFNDLEELAVIGTPSPDICFAFSFQEWEDLKEAIDEAIYMKEVYHLMRSNEHD